MSAGGDLSLNTLKLQFVMKSNYDALEVLIQKHVKQVKDCLQPLYEEILEADPDDEGDSESKKLYRKICIYILLSSGLGNPAVVTVFSNLLIAI